jgi:CCR4-NOT transcriptional regulation complex NOT5 subunit
VVCNFTTKGVWETQREREREMKEKSESGGGYVRADQIDLKSLDEQLQRHLSRAWTMEKNKSREQEQEQEQEARPTVTRHEWEIDPSKLIIKGVIARGTFGTVHRGIYDGQDVAGIGFFLIFFF